jgi:ribosomal protein S14
MYMQRETRTIEWATRRVREVLEDPLAKLILIILYNFGAISSANRISLSELAKRVGVHKWLILRKIRGARKHHAVLRGFVHYPDKGKRKGFYLLKAGVSLAKRLAEERRITKATVKSIARTLLARSTTSHQQVTIKSPSSHHQVTTKSPLSHRFPIYPSTLSPYHPVLTLSPANAEKNCQDDLKPVANELSQSQFGFREKQQCERCGRLTDELKKFSFTIRAELADLAPEAFRYRLRYLCDTCNRELTRQVVQAWKELNRQREQSGQQSE